MAQNSKIEWTRHTCNLWHGCVRVHAGCDHCYAETLSHRWGRDIWGADKPRMEIKSVWSDFKKYQEIAEDAGEMHNVFVGSMMDIFEKEMPLIDSKGNAVFSKHDSTFRLTTGALRYKYLLETVPYTPNLMHLMLTKRPSNIPKMIFDSWISDPPRNVMYGTSPCDQDTADTLIPQLLNAPGKHFLSCEPLLGPINICQAVRLWRFKKYGSFHSTFFNDVIDWVIVGGESGSGKRPMNLDWARDIRDQCRVAGVPFFMKQVDKVEPIPEDLMIREFPNR